MAWAFRASSSNLFAASSGTLAAPSGIASGDIVAAILSADGTGLTLGISGGSAWSQPVTTQNVTNGDTQTVAVFWKVAGASEPANYTVSNSGASGMSVSVAAWSGGSGVLDFSTIINPNSVTPPGSPVSMPATGGNTTAANNLNVYLGTVDWNSSNAAAFTGPSGYTDRAVHTPAAFANTYIGEQVQASVGATGSPAATGTLAGASGNYVAALLSFKIAGGSSGAALTGSPSGQATATAQPTTSITAKGQGAGTASARAQPTTTIAASSSAAAQASSTAQPTTAITATASGGGQATAQAQPTTSIPLAASASGGASASLTFSVVLTGSAAGMAASAAQMSTSIAMTSAAAAVASAFAQPTTAIVMLASASGGASAQAQPTTSITAQAFASGGAAASAQPTTSIALTGSASGGAFATAAFANPSAVTGSASGNASSSAQPTTQITLAGSASGGSFAQALMTVGPPQQQQQQYGHHHDDLIDRVLDKYATIEARRQRDAEKAREKAERARQLALARRERFEREAQPVALRDGPVHVEPRVEPRTNALPLPENLSLFDQPAPAQKVRIAPDRRAPTLPEDDSMQALLAAMCVAMLEEEEV